MEQNNFFAMISRMKYINRWGLMNNTRQENLSEHSLEVAVLAHALAVIHNTHFGGNANAERCALLALFHDSSEIITGDMPTPIKYYNKEIQNAYKDIELVAQHKLVTMLPQAMQPVYEGILIPQENDKKLWQFIKAADKLSALIKCIEERRMGNHEFVNAEETIMNTISVMPIPEVHFFVDELLPAYSLTLDEHEKGNHSEN